MLRWIIQSDGNVSKLVSFLEDLFTARDTAKEFFIDLFKGSALIWYRLIKDQVEIWRDIVIFLNGTFFRTG